MITIMFGKIMTALNKYVKPKNLLYNYQKRCDTDLSSMNASFTHCVLVSFGLSSPSLNSRALFTENFVQCLPPIVFDMAHERADQQTIK